MVSDSRPLVWYVAAGYKLPAGIEAYLCHYATEMRKHGFETRIIVFYPLPREKHRFLKLVEERGIKITSLYDETVFKAGLIALLFFIPWFLYILIRKRRFPDVQAFKEWIHNRCAIKWFRDEIAEGRPDVVHVKGRLPTNAWAIFPSDLTIYHHALMGTVDSSWTEKEVEDFRAFASRIAFIFVPGRHVAETLAREFRIKRRVESIFTMAPDEARTEADSGQLGGSAPVGKRIAVDKVWQCRFGILCRFNEQKGISYILEALKSFKQKYGDVVFTFTGQGNLEPMIREFIKLNNLYHVEIERMSEVSKVFEKMDVMVHPGLDDAMPVSIVEALMCSVPCISTRIGGVPDLIRDGVEGFLIEPGNSGQILECMERFRSMPVEEFRKFCRRARARYEDVCMPEKVGKIVAEYYHNITKGRTNAG
ncbi:MAG: hypothetical protein A2283_01905 [Lentisphaerae bacterium RIFOXYA12_FULL_48_11]|nr:MAG: hypothetical protein A2283_01905 [Lentisphaerae bacterium RIFOXYA12_FULL_48_11]